MNETEQKDTFIRSEGDKYYERNKEKLEAVNEKADKDQILASLRALNLRPSAVLEIGCSNGWRLEILRKTYAAQCSGVDPSTEAISKGKELFPNVALQIGTADKLPFDDCSFDLVILGFCLYMCDRKDLFKIAYEVDRVLRASGHIAILDFYPPFAYRNSYVHYHGMYAYKMNYSSMFTWNPAYVAVSLVVFNESDGSEQINEPDQRASVAILQKNTQVAYLSNPWATSLGHSGGP